MRLSNVSSLVLTAASLALIAPFSLSDALAQDANAAVRPPQAALRPPADIPGIQPLPKPAQIMGGGFKSSQDALRQGLRGYTAGDKAAAAKALGFAAEQGDPLAAWKLGSMYAEGDGVEQDDLKAFEHFSKIANDHADESPESQNARVVSSAFVKVGFYYLDGIPKTQVKPNPVLARRMFNYAASYFGDADAQYNLARLMLDGVGGERDAHSALRWLNLAAEKGHSSSQAMLGHLLFSGAASPKQVVRGLMWLEIAKSSADPVRDGWIIEMHQQAFSTASANDRATAIAHRDRYLKR